MPIYVGGHSVDVWAHQQLFDLGPSGFPASVSGVPPDAFSETGAVRCVGDGGGPANREQPNVGKQDGALGPFPASIRGVLPDTFSETGAGGVKGDRRAMKAGLGTVGSAARRP